MHLRCSFCSNIHKGSLLISGGLSHGQTPCSVRSLPGLWVAPKCLDVLRCKGDFQGAKLKEFVQPSLYRQQMKHAGGRSGRHSLNVKIVDPKGGDFPASHV